MGGDGGVIATKRAYFVKVKKAKEKRDPYEVAAQRWNTCALTNQRLRHPVRARAGPCLGPVLGSGLGC